jgi:hypothetical protein
MPRPVSTATVRPDLGALAFEYAAEASQRGFIADMLMPVFETPLESAQYPVIPSEGFLKLYETKRAARAKYNSSDFEFDFQTFACKEHGWEEQIDDREVNLYSRYFDLEMVSTMRAVDIMLRNREKRVADKLLNVANFTNAAGAAKWSDTPVSDPRGDVQTAINAVRNATGMRPNCVAMSYTLFEYVCSSKAFQDATKYTDQTLLQNIEYRKAKVAAWLGVDEILVGEAVYDTAKKGQSTSTSDIWDSTKALVCRIAKSPKDLREPCIGRSMLWTADSPQILTTETYRSEEKRGNVVRVRHNIDEVFVFQACGRLITGL